MSPLIETCHTGRKNQNFIPGLAPTNWLPKLSGLAWAQLTLFCNIERGKDGGCESYIKNNMPFVVRQELTKKHSSSQSEYEAQWD